ncbi:hypothetical protein B1222_01545 [Paenibacillus larvae subsp. pulvifaciens]|nr:DUF817 domain-containing protein [Paenibacillus larvae]AQT86651.1 hypothetical protein B1222_01545 [Paenibacillus larvae subsp. pulvifaciens]AQZ49232.1 hypothetical protein B5S25_19995 [Paenibacillus larvae subsp. pulvifaciens]MBH0342229.1 hypothetical protein [Paenibacillus larvae]MCY7518395.1 DUF817 domain-containing protein [Paenibacillus larvae]MCY9501999.1 DUF817 domain-containing protein [Paenibacillus larvae]
MILQLWRFGLEQAKSCVFAVAVFATLAVSKMIHIPWLPRYDLILLVLLAVQVWMYRSGKETLDEIKVICVFHLIGLGLELYKVHMGSWAYPEPALTKICGVPLYSGFMYASVASYLCQAWRRFDLRLTSWPHPFLTVSLSAVIYANFFTHHFIMDLRWVLLAAVFAVFLRVQVSYRVGHETYRMPLALSFLLIGFFIWVAENIATFFGAWQYPNQREGWSLVDFSKISSWYLLVIISIIIVAQLKHVKAKRPTGNPAMTREPETKKRVLSFRGIAIHPIEDSPDE